MRIIFISRYLLNSNNAYIGSFTWYNSIGLSTQVTAKIELISNIDFKFDFVSFKIIKSKIPITKENLRILQFLDFLGDVNCIASFSPEQGFRYVYTILSNVDVNLIIKLASKYNQIVQLNLFKLLEVMVWS